jgi:hypothetical protein
LFPGVDQGSGRVIGGESFGRTPDATSSRILAGRSAVDTVYLLDLLQSRLGCART